MSRMSWPSMTIAPSSMSMKRSNSFDSVDLPEPDGPTSATCSPGFTVSVQVVEQSVVGSVAESHLVEFDSPARTPGVATASGSIG